jgi:high-affinity iron transporter
MAATLIVIFREMFEIALILGVVLAATKGMAGRNKWALIGIAGGVTGAAVIALFMEEITSLAQGNGQEIMNGSIMLLAALMIGWTVVWMKTHGREMSQKMKAVGQSIREGDTPLYTLAVIIALAVFREGSEIVLFSFGLLASGTTVPAFIEGALLGAAAGAGVGALVYFGLLRLFTRHFFTVTTWLLTLLAAGMASQGVNQFAQIGYLPDLGGPFWNSSRLISENSWLGQSLKVLVGYASQPLGIQLLAYGATILVIFGAMKLIKHAPAPQKPKAA